MLLNKTSELGTAHPQLPGKSEYDDFWLFPLCNHEAE